MTDTTSIKHPTPLTSGDFTAADEPFALFGEWFAEAVKSEPNDPNAMSLATVDADGLPDVRMVLMKGYDADGFVFYSHVASQKGRELAANPKAALLFHWKSLRRQVRIRGNVTPVTAEEADAYFATRPKQAQIGAWASKQSQALESRFAFEQAIALVAARRLRRDRGVVDQRVQFVVIEPPANFRDRARGVGGTAEVDLDVILGARAPGADFRKGMPRAGDDAPARGREPDRGRMADAPAGAGQKQRAPRRVG